jgi:hypothetical protein
MGQMIAWATVMVYLLALFLVLAVIVFAYLQYDINRPEYREENEQWFREFEANQRRRYRDADLHWRIHDLGDYFAKNQSPEGKTGNHPDLA